MGSFLEIIIVQVIWALTTIITVSVVLSWLVAFDVLNLRNRLAYSVVRALDSVSEPVLRPFRRLIPTLGGVDLSPILAVIVLTAAAKGLVPWLFSLLPPALG